MGERLISGAGERSDFYIFDFERYNTSDLNFHLGGVSHNLWRGQARQVVLRLISHPYRMNFVANKYHIGYFIFKEQELNY